MRISDWSSDVCSSDLDQSIVDLAYEVRWSIRDPELFIFQLADPEGTIREVAESAMRATVANFDLVQAIGPGRVDIEADVQRRMQELLDQYRAGVLIQGIAIRQRSEEHTSELQSLMRISYAV